MQLLSFSSKNVHGYLNFDMHFRKDVTFLIGINGTGKTSILKIILGLISPSYSYLNQIDFEYAKLECVDEGQPVIIEATKDANEGILALTLTKRRQVLKGKLLKYNPTDIDNDFLSDDETSHVANLKKEFDAQQIIQEIKKLSTPIFLGLDRRIYEGYKIDRLRQTFIQQRKFRKYRFSDPLNMSLLDFQAAIYNFYRQIALQQPEINEKFRNQIISRSFDFIEGSQFASMKDLIDLNVKREHVIKAIEQLNMLFFVPHINDFFDKMEEVQSQIKRAQNNQKTDSTVNFESLLSAEMDFTVVQKWLNNQPQLQRINDIIEFSQQYQKQIQSLYEPIERLKRIVNSFLIENNKRLEINRNGDLTVVLGNGTPTPVFELSSGEKQIITIIGHLIFFEEQFGKEPGVFIIDEPELSLHLAWQEILVASIIEASPKTQLILATHSPSILERYQEDHLIDLSKLNITR